MASIHGVPHRAAAAEQGRQRRRAAGCRARRCPRAGRCPWADNAPQGEPWLLNCSMIEITADVHSRGGCSGGSRAISCL
jgi:hypothetical protein